MSVTIDIRNCIHWGNKSIETPCPSVLVRCALVASQVDNVSEITSSVSNYASPVNKWKSCLLGHIETSPPVILRKLLLLSESEYFHQGPGCSAAWLLRFRIAGTAIDTGHLVSQITHINRTRFLGNFLAP